MRPRSHIAIAFLSVTLGCGDAQYVEYESAALKEVNEGVTTTDPTCSQAALEVYVELLAPAVDGLCTSCHASGNSFLLISGSHATNRDALAQWSNYDATQVNQFFGPTGTHEGGNLSSVLTPSNVTQWLEAEAECQTP